MSNSLFKTINNMSYRCNMEHLHSYWPYSHKFYWKDLSSGIIDCEISDHQLIFCTRKVERLKLHKQNNVLLRSLKHYAVNLFVEDLGKVPSKEIRFKNNNQDWFDRKVVDLIHVREKLFLKFKKSKLHIDEEIYQKIRNKV